MIKSNITKYYFTERVSEAENQLPEEVMGQSSVTESLNKLGINTCPSSKNIKNKINKI